jgi:hypothetical protein
VRLAERDEAVRRAVAAYLAEKAKDGTPKQREIAKKIPQRHPVFSASRLALPLSRSQQCCVTSRCVKPAEKRRGSAF